MSKPLDGLLRCAEHGCPMIGIGDEVYCAFEYIDSLIGGEQVVDMTGGQGKEPARLVFSNGRSIPLLCTCCGKHLLLEDAAAFRASIVGLYLDALDHDPEGPAEAIQFIFAPTLSGGSGAGPAEEDLWFLELHLDSVRQVEQVQRGARRPPARKRPRKRKKRKRR